MDFADFRPKHFVWSLSEGIAKIVLNRPERKNPLTFDSYAELRDTFRALELSQDVRVVVVSGAGANFSSGGDVHDIIRPLTEMSMPDVLRFTRMTGALIQAMRTCPQIVVAAIDGICVGAGAAVAMASDLRIGTERSKVAFLFSKVGLAGCDMGACALLPRIIGQGRAAELLISGRSMHGEECLTNGFYNRLCAPEHLWEVVDEVSNEIAKGPTFAHGMTKKMLNQEWNMGIVEAIESEAQAQAICMKTNDFRRAYEGFVEKRSAEFEGN